jgi:hypothetical protein
MPLANIGIRHGPLYAISHPRCQSGHAARSLAENDILKIEVSDWQLPLTAIEKKMCPVRLMWSACEVKQGKFFALVV